MEEKVHHSTGTKQTVDIQVIQRLCYETLCDIDDYCRENHILYFLSGGSCLGAVRHHGFIPWDDDADIMLPRPEYERFISGFAKQYGDKYGVGALNLTEEWVRPYARIWRRDTRLAHRGSLEMEMGIFVDVFPIDGVPRNALVRKLYYKYGLFLNFCKNSALHKGFSVHERAKKLKKLASPVCERIGARRFACMQDALFRKYDFQKEKLVGAVSACHYWDRETVPRTCMSEAADCQFCDRLFPVPRGYDTYLRSLYGDYMKMPSQEEAQASMHQLNWDIEILPNNGDPAPPNQEQQ